MEQLLNDFFWDVLQTQFCSKYLHYIVLCHAHTRGCTFTHAHFQCVNNLSLITWPFSTLPWERAEIFFSHSQADKKAIVLLTNYYLTHNNEYSRKTLNIDCCVLTLGSNGIKTNINHMLAHQQTLLNPIMKATQWSLPLSKTFASFIHVNLNFRCTGMICKISSIQVCICTSLSEQWGVWSTCVICWPYKFALQRK